MILTCAFSAILITELSSALIIQSHSKLVQINEENIPELGTKILINWFHRHIDLGTFQSIIDTYFHRIFKKQQFRDFDQLKNSKELNGKVVLISLADWVWS